MDQLEPTLLVIPLLAVLAPLFARSISRWVRIPIVVFELVLGILVGPSLLGWAVPSEFVGALSEFGLAMLFFVAGSEIEFAAFRGRAGRFAVIGWLLSLRPRGRAHVVPVPRRGRHRRRHRAVLDGARHDPPDPA